MFFGEWKSDGPERVFLEKSEIKKVTNKLVTYFSG